MGLKRGNRSRGEADDVRHDAHRRLGRVDEGVADHELLEDVVLHGAREGTALDPLLFRRRHEHREHRQHRSVHGHRHRHAIEGDALEEALHVFDGVDGDPRLADVARHPRVIGVIAAVGWRDRRRRRGRSDPPRGCAGRRRWTPPRWSTPAYWRSVQGRPVYIDARGPRRYGASPGRVSRCSISSRSEAV